MARVKTFLFLECWAKPTKKYLLYFSPSLRHPRPKSHRRGHLAPCKNSNFVFVMLPIELTYHTTTGHEISMAQYNFTELTLRSSCIAGVETLGKSFDQSTGNTPCDMMRTRLARQWNIKLRSLNPHYILNSRILQDTFYHVAPVFDSTPTSSSPILSMSGLILCSDIQPSSPSFSPLGQLRNGSGLERYTQGVWNLVTITTSLHL